MRSDFLVKLGWEYRILYLQVGLYGQELSEELGPPVTLVTSLPVRTGSLVDLEEGEEERVTWGGGITLADSIAPYWFAPSEGSAVIYFIHVLGHMYTCTHACTHTHTHTHTRTQTHTHTHT